MAIYAEITAGTVTNITVCDDATFAATQGWTDIDSLDPQPGVGWTLANGAWTPPSIPATTTNMADTVKQVRTDLAVILTWLANNPNGAVLTAAQTRVLARIMANLCIYDLQDSSQPPVTT